MLAKNQLLICLLCASCVHAADDVTTKIMPESKTTESVTVKKNVASKTDAPMVEVDINIAKSRAGATSVAEPSKTEMPIIALVDVQKVINETQVDREHVEVLFEKQQSFQKELQGKGETIQKKEKELKTKASTLSAEALKKLYEELDDMRVQGNRLAERRQKELQEEEMKTRFNVFKTIQGYTETLIKQNPQVKIIVEKNSVLAFGPGIDKTDELIKIVKADMAKKEATKKKKDVTKKTEEVKEKVAPKVTTPIAA